MPLPTPREILEEEDIPSEDLDTLCENIDVATRSIFEDYGVPLDDPDTIINLVQMEILQEVIHLGTELDDRTLHEQFEMVADDFEDPNSTSARSNIIFIAGHAYNEDNPEPLRQLSGAILARNYEQVD